MENKEILENIKKKLTGNKENDVAFLHDELRKYQKANNFNVAFGIQLLLFNYLSDEEKEKLNQGANAMLLDHKNKFESAKELLNFGEIERAKRIFIELFDSYEKVGVLEGANFYDFPDPIELFLYLPKLRNVKIKRLPEPVIYYAYQIASIYLEQDDINSAIIYLEKALLFNPICQYVLQELIDRLMMTKQYERAYMHLKTSLKYAYTKNQLAFCYKKLGEYFKHIAKYDLAIASYALSSLYLEDVENKIKIKEIVDLVGPIKFSSPDEIINLFKTVDLNYGPSKEVLATLKEYTKISKERKDYKTLKYILNIAINLTNQDYFKNELESLKKVKND